LQTPKSFTFNKGAIWLYPAVFAFGIVVGFRLVPSAVLGVMHVGLGVALVIMASTGNVYAFFKWLPYIVFNEILVRDVARFLPYLTVQYLLIASFALMLLTGPKNKKAHFSGYIIFALFMLLELLNNIHPDKPQISRSIMANSFALLAAVVWGAFNIMNPILLNRLLYNIKIAGVYLAGVVFVAHLQGKIDYNSASSSDASNGMAPVQLSGYLGTACILFFLSVMNKDEAKFRVINLVFLAITATVMILTFSRGGLYFLGAVICMFLFYNRAKIGEYAKFIFMIPVALIIYSLVVEETGGKIVERYEQKGASSRDILVEIGFDIFSRNPIIGVGTGNYNTTIVKDKLFYVESGAHNEFVRVAAEHGIFGILLFWGFFVALFFNIRGRGQPQQQFAMFFFALFCLITIHNGLKISLQPIILLLAVSIQSLPYRPNHNVEHRQLAEAQPA
jgi:O-antigen ligase